MTGAASFRVGWCPSAHRPMLAGDGLILRVKPRAGVFSVAQLAVIAEVAATCGNGAIDMTRRANVQIRGVTENSFTAALERLYRARLIDDDPAAEQIRNVTVDPLSDQCRWIAAGLEQALTADKKFHSLPAKFGFAVYDAAAPRVQADINLQAFANGSVRLSLDGDPASSFDCPNSQAADAARSLALAFLTIQEGNRSVRRMRHLVQHQGAPSLFAAAGLAPISPLPLPSPIGVFQLGLIGDNVINGAAVAPPFGRVDAGDLKTFAELLTSLDLAEVRLSHRRAFVVPLKEALEAQALMSWAAGKGWMTDANDPRGRIDVCTGRPGCTRSTTDTRRDAAAIAADFLKHRPDVKSVHISGCGKGCARSASADFTLVARGGLYDIICAGAIDAPPVRKNVPAGQIVIELCGLHGGAYG